MIFSDMLFVGVEQVLRWGLEQDFLVCLHRVDVSVRNELHDRMLARTVHALHQSEASYL